MTTSLNRISQLLLLAVPFLFLACQPAKEQHTQAESSEVKTTSSEPSPLFDGASLANWEGDLAFFRIEDRAIVAGSMEKEIPTNKFLCTEQTYGDFELTLAVKFPTINNNGGIQIRSKRIPDHHEVIGYQVDVGYAGSKPVWASIYDESRRNRFVAEAPEEYIGALLKANDFNDYKIRCEGPRIQVWFNGQQVVDYTEEEEGIDQSGIICVQIHSGPPSEAWYKDIVIQEL